MLVVETEKTNVTRKVPKYVLSVCCPDEGTIFTMPYPVVPDSLVKACHKTKIVDALALLQEHQIDPTEVVFDVQAAERGGEYYAAAVDLTYRQAIQVVADRLSVEAVIAHRAEQQAGTPVVDLEPAPDDRPAVAEACCDPAPYQGEPEAHFFAGAAADLPPDLFDRIVRKDPNRTVLVQPNGTVLVTHPQD
jgi:hypothetical protein